MADIELTSGDDVYDHTKGKDFTTIKGLAGNDKITIHGNAWVVGGAGNDELINDEFDWVSGGVAYWDSPGKIYVDLEAGFALDGYGTRDTLVNFRSVAIPGKDGDEVFGTAKSDEVWLNVFWPNRSAGSATIDLRGGVDRANIHLKIPKESFQIEVSIDGKTAWLTAEKFTVKLLNVENLMFREEIAGQYVDETIRFLDLIDFNKVGPATLVENKSDAWAVSPGKTISFSFMNAAPTYGGTEGGSGFVPPSNEYKAAVRSILDRLSQEVGLAFTEVADSASSYGQLRFGANQQANTKGYAFVPGQVKDDRAGDVWLDIETLQVMGKGQEGWQVLLHELGHALGLSHPHSESETSSATKLLDAWNNNSYTVMSANQSANKLWQSWFGALDIQALQSFYGAAKGAVSSEDV